MPKVLLNAKIVESIKPPAQGVLEYHDEKVPGLMLRVYESGRKSWSVRTKTGHLKRRVTIGDSRFISLLDARERAHAVLAAAISGKSNPYESVASMTFDALAAEYLQKHARPKKRTWKEDERKIHRNLIPCFGGKLLSEIRRRDVVHFLDDLVETRGEQIIINRLFEVLRKMFNFAVEREYLESSPCYMVKKPVKERSRERFLDEVEIPKVWGAIRRLRGIVRLLMMFYMLSGQRACEVKYCKRSHIDLESNWWTIPVELSKNGKPHRVPITPEMRLVIEESLRSCRDSEWLFPSPRLYRQDGELRDCPITTLQRVIDRVRSSSGVNFNGHDLRRTMATWLSSRRTPRIVITCLLNHTDRSITAVYDRHVFDVEKRESLEKWTHFVEKSILKNESESAVLKET